MGRGRIILSPALRGPANGTGRGAAYVGAEKGPVRGPGPDRRWAQRKERRGRTGRDDGCGGRRRRVAGWSAGAGGDAARPQ